MQPALDVDLAALREVLASDLRQAGEAHDLVPLRLLLAVTVAIVPAPVRRQAETEWHQIVCFARLAEIAGEFLAKGRQVYVEGRLHTSSWEDSQTGETRYKTEIVCENLQMLGAGSQAATEAGAEAPEPAEPAEPAEPTKPAPKKRTRRKPAQKKA